MWATRCSSQVVSVSRGGSPDSRTSSLSALDALGQSRITASTGRHASGSDGRACRAPPRPASRPRPERSRRPARGRPGAADDLVVVALGVGSQRPAAWLDGLSRGRCCRRREQTRAHNSLDKRRQSPDMSAEAEELSTSLRHRRRTRNTHDLRPVRSASRSRSRDVGLALILFRAAHAHPGHDRGERRPAGHPCRPRLHPLRPLLGAQRLRAQLRRPAAPRRSPR